MKEFRIELLVEIPDYVSKEAFADFLYEEFIKHEINKIKEVNILKEEAIK